MNLSKLFKYTAVAGSIAYIVGELYSHYKHVKMVKNLNKFTINPTLSSCEQDKAKHKNIREMTITNIIEHDKDSKRFCEHLFYNKLKFDNIPRNLLSHSIGSMMFMRDKLSDDENAEINDYVSRIEKKHDIVLKDSTIKHDYIVFSRTPIYTWYKPLFLRCMMYFAKKVFNRYLYNLGFTRHQFPNGYVVWVRKCPKNNAQHNPLVLFHCSIGGFIPYYKIIKEIMIGRTLFLSEVPGVSWENYVSTPPLLNEIAENLHEVVSQHGIEKYDLLCHSFGGLLCMKYFYKYHNEVVRIICIESGVILNHIFNMYSEFYEIAAMRRKGMIDFLCAMITNRDMYTQFYFHRDLSISDTILLGRPEENNKDIHLVLSEEDDKIPAEYYSHYIQSKKLPYKVKTFPKREHGAFIYDKEFQDYVISVLNSNKSGIIEKPIACLNH